MTSFRADRKNIHLFITFARDISSHDCKHFMPTYFEINQRMTKLQSGHKNRPRFLPLTYKYDLDLKATDLDIGRDTSSHACKHLCQVILKSTKGRQSYRSDTKMSDRRYVIIIRANICKFLFLKVL